MKCFLILVFCLCYSATGLGKELYCETTEGKASPFPDPRIINMHDYSLYQNLLVIHGFPFGNDKCGPEKYPELVKLSRIIQYDINNYKKSGFKFYETFSGKFIVKEFALVSDVEIDDAEFKYPLDAYRFSKFIKNKKLPNKISMVNYKIYLNEYKQDMKDKLEVVAKKQLEQKALLDKITKEREEAAAVEKIIPFNEEFKRRYYIFTIIVNADLALSEKELFIKNKFAENQNDFYQRLLFACYEINCNEDLKAKISRKVTTYDLIFYGKQLIHYSIAYNNLDEVKQILKAKPEIQISLEDLSLSAHFEDGKLFNFLEEFVGERFNNKDLILDRQVARSLMGANAFSSLNFQRMHKIEKSFYPNYFMDRNKKYSPKHILGYFSLDEFYFQYADEKIKEVGTKAGLKVTPGEVIIYGFEKPDWSSNKMIIRDEESKIVQPFKTKSVSDDVDHYYFNEIQNNWLGIKIDQKTIWLHVSQTKNLLFIDQSFYDTSLEVTNVDELYTSPAGNKISKDKTEKYGKTILEVINSKWISGELWLNINLSPESSDEGEENKVRVNNIWFKPYTEGRENFKESRGC